EIQGKIADDWRLVSVFDVTGYYDSMVVALERYREDLNDFTKTVLSLDGIERSHTHMVLNSVKNTWIGLPEDSESYD
ncbi:MAG: Lrp/AsnC ligand binding domain-containing protein, partial [Candidatus Thermoplasmatota archaeon]|nr:Lrp/AsnC ligand binding domain-containing protein [Candidatus Thermoplasmatota archaeon]